MISVISDIYRFLFYFNYTQTEFVENAVNYKSVNTVNMLELKEKDYVKK